VALEEHPVQVRVSMSQFGWDVTEYEKDEIFAIVDAFTAGIGEAAKRERYVVRAPEDYMALVDVLKVALRETRAVRCVIDSVTTLYITKPAAARGLVLQLKKVLSGIGVTMILISQVSVTERVRWTGGFNTRLTG
jgi:KaiC/GvpD/RAD55 family RecA-like ATPase